MYQGTSVYTRVPVYVPGYQCMYQGTSLCTRVPVYVSGYQSISSIHYNLTPSHKTIKLISYFSECFPGPFMNIRTNIIEMKY